MEYLLDDVKGLIAEKSAEFQSRASCWARELENK